MINQVKILIIADNNTTVYTDSIERKIADKGYQVDKITPDTLLAEYGKSATAPSFFIVKNNKAAYMLPGKRDANSILKWIEDSNLI